mgnify:CR=1 FL=1
MVMEPDDWTGGLHDGNASGGPCVRFGAVHALYAGTIDAVDPTLIRTLMDAGFVVLVPAALAMVTLRPAEAILVLAVVGAVRRGRVGRGRWWTRGCRSPPSRPEC